MSNLYYYTVLLASGATRRGLLDVQAPSRWAADEALQASVPGSMLIRSVNLGASDGFVARLCKRAMLGAVKEDEVASLLRDLGVMVECGVPVMDAIRDVRQDREQEGSQALRQLCQRLQGDVLAGATVGEAFSRQAHIFSPTVRSLLRIGDETGTVATMLLEAAQHLERMRGLRSASKQALIYPAFSLMAVLGAAGFWIVYVMPNLAAMFKQFNAQLPRLTIWVLGSSEWLAEHLFTVALFGMAMVVLLAGGWRRSDAFRLWGYTWLHRLPVAKRLISASAFALLCEYLAILTRAGIDIVKSLQILEEATVDRYVRERVGRVRRSVQKGDRLAHSMRAAGGFPNLLVRMIEVGENSGTMERQLQHLSSEYSARLQRIVGTLSEIIKPLVVVLVGGVFAVLIAALLLPIYDLIKQTMSGVR